MATRRRTTTRRPVRRTTTRRRASAKKSVKLKIKPSVIREIWAVFYFALSILTVLSIKGAFGIVGDFWISVLSPVIGWGIYIVPVLFFVLSLMMFFSQKIKFTSVRIFGIFLFMFSVLSILHLSVPLEFIRDYAANGTYGGYVGFVSNFLLLEVLGVHMIAGAVIFVATFLVSLLLVFELSLKELATFLIPNIKIELIKDEKRPKKSRERSNNIKPALIEGETVDIDDDDQPEIMIRRALMDNGKSSSKKVDHIIYEDEKSDSNKSNKSTKSSVVELSSDQQVLPIVNDFENDLSKKEMDAEMEEDYEWEFPSFDLLKEGTSEVRVDDDLLMMNAETIKQKLKKFGIEVVMREVNVGPTVIQYTLKPSEGVKLSKITSLKNDLALAMAAERIRIEAPIPGKSLVGIEVPNEYRAIVYLKEILESAIFTDAKSKLTFPLGRDVSGKPIIANLETMPHLLVAGATGSGKSVAMNTFLISLLFQNSPKDLKLILIDPKRVELSSYNNIPHLLTPVIEDPEKASVALRWVVSEMTRRYKELSSHKVRNLAQFNALKGISEMPKIVVVIDELADLMMTAGKEVEASICRIAQMARAVGIHLVIATQRPSVDVITGLIKANIPSRISFAVSSSIDSRTILDATGAEDLLGRGDMLYLPAGVNKPVRVQGIYVSNEEINRVTNRIKLTKEPSYDENVTSPDTAKGSLVGIPDSKAGSGDDALYEAAYQLVMESRKASASLFQRRLKVGYARAARLIDLLEENGVVGPSNGAKPRKILLSG